MAGRAEGRAAGAGAGAHPRGSLLVRLERLDREDRRRGGERSAAQDYFHHQEEGSARPSRLQEAAGGYREAVRRSPEAAPRKVRDRCAPHGHHQAGLGRGLQFELFKPAAEETTREFYAELPITIRITGNYHDIGAFASDVGKLSRIVTLNDITLTAAKDSTLIMDAVAKTFRYLDDEEIATQRKAAAKDKKGGK